MNLDHYKNKNYAFQNVIKASNQPNFEGLHEIKAHHLRDMAETFQDLLTDAILLKDENEKLKKLMNGEPVIKTTLTTPFKVVFPDNPENDFEVLYHPI